MGTRRSVSLGSLRDCLRMPSVLNTSRLRKPKKKPPKAMRNQRLCIDGFQLAKLVWPSVVLGDAHRFMTGAEQIVNREFNAPFRREETFDEFLVATERIGPLIVDSREVLDLKLDTGNCGPTYDDLNEAAQRMCCREPLHDGCARSDVVRALPQCDAPGSRQCKRQTSSASCANSSKQLIKGCASVPACQDCGRSAMDPSSWNHQQEPGVSDCVSGEHHPPMPKNVPWA